MGAMTLLDVHETLYIYIPFPNCVHIIELQNTFISNCIYVCNGCCHIDVTGVAKQANKFRVKYRFST